MTAKAMGAESRVAVASLGGALLVGGGVLSLLGNLLHPRFTGDDQVAIYRQVAAADRLVVADLALIAGVLVMTAGLVEGARIVRSRGAQLLGPLGGAAALVGGAIAVLQCAVDAYAFRQAAIIFASAADNKNRVGAFYATAAVDRVNTAMISTWTLLLLGVTPLLLSAAMWITADVPKWLPVVGGVGAVACTVTALFNLVVQADQSVLTWVFLVGALLVTAWVIAWGWFLMHPSAGITGRSKE
jgi:hypothetical protein